MPQVGGEHRQGPARRLPPLPGSFEGIDGKGMPQAVGRGCAEDEIGDDPARLGQPDIVYRLVEGRINASRGQGPICLSGQEKRVGVGRPQGPADGQIVVDFPGSSFGSGINRSLPNLVLQMERVFSSAR